jgi:AraC-like DNA-binding protein
MNSWVRSAVLTGARELIQELGGDTEAVIRDAGIEAAAFNEPGFPVPVGAVLSFFENAATTCRCENFGLRLSRRQDLSLLGPIWTLIQSASTVGKMLHDLAEYYLLYTSGGLLSVETSARGMTLNYNFAAGVDPVDRHALELMYGVMVLELRKSRPGWVPQMTQFRHNAPKDLRLHREFFGRDMMFNADINAFTVDAAILATPLPARDDDTHRALALRFDQQRRLLPGMQKLRAETAIRALLPFASCDRAAVARALKMSSRRLKYLLAIDNTSFDHLLDAVRADLAMRYLRQSDLAVSEIAEILGFAETSVLTRAFRRWYGVSPRTARQMAVGR